jgi:hypothetical protein
VKIRDALGVTDRRQRQVVRAMQVILVGLVFVGIYDLNLGIVVNGVLGLGITYLPAVLERDYRVPMDAGLTLWITTAVFLHTLGTVGLPGGESFYSTVPWWDSLTHTLSASVVAGAGYAAVRAIDEHTDAVAFPRRFLVVFILLFVMAFGVFWEILEFGVGGLAALTGTDSVLTQYGLADTLLDLVFDAVGAVVVAVWGHAHLTDVTGALANRLGQRDP